MIDAHCHIDLFKNPVAVANDSERLGITTLAVTNLPSHFEMGFPHLKNYRHVRLALGMHPLEAEHHDKEMPIFIRNISNTTYIGEIGLDYSSEGIGTKEIQLKTFCRILSLLKRQPKILSLHSRKAESVVLNLLIDNEIKYAIFHWYSGSLTLIEKIVAEGYYFSVNPAMIISQSGKEIIKRIPKEKLLTETDGPFVTVNGKMANPKDVIFVLKYLSEVWNTTITEAEQQVKENFFGIINSLKKSI